MIFSIDNKKGNGQRYLNGIGANVWIKKGRSYLQLMKDILLFLSGEETVSDYYRALKAKWEDLDYYNDEK